MQDDDFDDDDVEEKGLQWARQGSRGRMRNQSGSASVPEAGSTVEANVWGGNLQRFAVGNMKRGQQQTANKPASREMNGDSAQQSGLGRRLLTGRIIGGFERRGIGDGMPDPQDPK